MPFTCMAHPDLVKKFGYRPSFNPQPLYDEAAEAVQSSGRMVEVNTSGLRQKIGRALPDLPLVRRYRELGGELLTMGSDAHTPGQVGGFFPQTAEILKSCGFRYYTVYHQRKPVFYPL